MLRPLKVVSFAGSLLIYRLRCYEGWLTQETDRRGVVHLAELQYHYWVVEGGATHLGIFKAVVIDVLVLLEEHDRALSGQFTLEVRFGFHLADRGLRILGSRAISTHGCRKKDDVRGRRSRANYC